MNGLGRYPAERRKGVRERKEHTTSDGSYDNELTTTKQQESKLNFIHCPTV